MLSGEESNNAIVRGVIGNLQSFLAEGSSNPGSADRRKAIISSSRKFLGKVRFGKVADTYNGRCLACG